jgi:protein-S-isoprenylcysteine O-methyltransferase Ste14
MTKDAFSRLFAFEVVSFFALFLVRNGLELNRALRFRLGIPPHGRITLVLLFGTMIAAYILALVDLLTGRATQTLLFLGGLALYVASFSIREACSWHMGGSYANTLEPKGNGLATTGLFAHIRHPIYLFYGMEPIALILMTANPFVAVLAGLYFILISFRIRHEEEHLIRTYGDAYRDYIKTTKRLLPFIY